MIDSMIVLLLLLFPSVIYSQPCPHDCSAHGHCLQNSRQCACFQGYTGYDCSLKACPMGTAWTGYASGNDNSHTMVECSNNGICDRLLGTCNCRLNYEGIACQRNSCPSNCNGRGKCLSMRNFAATKDRGSATPVYAYNAVWDADMMYGCLCDPGYWGPDCAKRYCPVGDDPLTGIVNPIQYNDKQTIVCAASGGTFRLTYKGQTTQPLRFNARADQVLAALEALSTIGGINDEPAVGMTKVRVDMSLTTQACLPAGATWTIEFLEEFGRLPNFVPISTSLLPSGSATLSVTKAVVGTKESVQCSNRGTCDAVGGSCSCSLSFDSSDGYGNQGTRNDCGWPTTTIQYCPGLVSCSGHGECQNSPTYVCVCQVGWTGADCSERLCPTGPSWFNFPTNDNVAHLATYSECSDMGACDRTTGVCQCVTGYTGQACQNRLCPGAITQCNGQGKCYDMSTLAAVTKVNGVIAKYTYGATPGNPLTWDATRLFGCACDDTFTGYDCSLRTCPFGDDPLTVNQADEVQLLTCQDSDMTGTVLFTFREATGAPLFPSATSADVKANLEAIPTVGKVSVEPWLPNGLDQLCSQSGNQLMVTFLTKHGDLPPLTPTIAAIDQFNVGTYVDGTKENIECSGRGNCDRLTAVCSCFDGYGSSDAMGNEGVIGDCGYQMPILVTYSV